MSMRAFEQTGKYYKSDMREKIKKHKKFNVKRNNASLQCVHHAIYCGGGK
jgi:hypothetical protein